MACGPLEILHAVVYLNEKLSHAPDLCSDTRYTTLPCADHHQPIMQRPACAIGLTATPNKTRTDPHGEYMGQWSPSVRWREGEAQTKGAKDITTYLC